MGTPHHSPHDASAWSTPIHAPPPVPSLQRRITTPRSGRTPVPGSALRPSPQRAYMVHVLIRHPSLPSGQTTAKKCPRIRYQAEPAAAQTPTVSGVDAPGVLSAWPPICAHYLWQRCLAPRPGLPASLRRHLRAPRRVRHQHSKVAVPMLARRWYQARNPIQKLTCAQPQFKKNASFSATDA